jgi:hypothetical protein
MTASAIWRSTCERTCSSIGAETSVNRETIGSCVLFTTSNALAPLRPLLAQLALTVTFYLSMPPPYNSI